MERNDWRVLQTSKDWGRAFESWCIPTVESHLSIKCVFAFTNFVGFASRVIRMSSIIRMFRPNRSPGKLRQEHSAERNTVKETSQLKKRPQETFVDRTANIYLLIDYVRKLAMDETTSPVSSFFWRTRSYKEFPAHPSKAQLGMMFSLLWLIGFGLTQERRQKRLRFARKV